ncbi:TonB-dependent receptor [Novacetimonas pomaceti]|uniref:TonB-dependent receptor n=1 Tax=Novacetimonas pomaceti TaxID=2021998 RepID=UPI001C2DE9DA|nr:TonB-dependent receptor plug domain-containing protein [Novacetimonas pomaceti]MBV1835295.1 TonB-dependent receptor [Novacetimonas pomaceti]
MVSLRSSLRYASALRSITLTLPTLAFSASLSQGHAATAGQTTPSPRPVHATAHAAKPAAATPKAQRKPVVASQTENITVMARKHAESLQNVPMAVSVVTANSMLKQNAISIFDYFRQVPGLAVSTNGRGFVTPVIRGISSGDGNTPTTGVYIDDMPITSSSALAGGDQLMPDLDPAELQQVEVLKGPQGTLYGASAMGGIMKYVTRDPNMRKMTGQVAVTGTSVAGGDQGGAVRASISTPLIKDKLAITGSYFYRDDPGWIQDPLQGKGTHNMAHASGGRGALVWKPADWYTLRLSALSSIRTANGSSLVDYDTTTDRPVYGRLEQRRMPGTDTSQARINAFNATNSFDIAGLNLTSSTSYVESQYTGLWDVTTTFQPLLTDYVGLPSNYHYALDQQMGTSKFSQEVRLGRDEFHHFLTWHAGFFFTHERSYAYQQINAANGQSMIPTSDLDLAQESTKSLYDEVAGFGDVTLHLTRRFDLQGGVRYSAIRQDATINDDDGILSDGTQARIKDHFNVPTFLVTPTYHVMTNLMVYARIASGYRSGGPNIGVSQGATTFRPDKTLDYEIGTKGNFDHHRGTFDVSLYWTDWKDIQLVGLNSESEGITVNGGHAVSNGLEISGSYRILPGFTIGGYFNYTNAHLTSSFNTGTVYGRSGNLLPYTARITGDIHADYNFDINEHWSGHVGAEYSYVGDRLGVFQSSAAIPRYRLPAYSQVNFNMGIQHGRYSLDFSARNLTNARGILAMSARTITKTGLVGASLVQPSSFSLTASVKF